MTWPIGIEDPTTGEMISTRDLAEILAGGGRTRDPDAAERWASVAEAYAWLRRVGLYGFRPARIYR